MRRLLLPAATLYTYLETDYRPRVCSNRRLDNNFNIFEGLTKNWFFIAISITMCAGQILIVLVGNVAFNISPLGQTPAMWGYAIVLGFVSIPFGVIIRLIPDRLLERLVPDSLKQASHSKVPGVTVSDDEERFSYYPSPLADIRDELAWLKRVKGGRLNNLKFAMKHPREFMPKMKSPSHSRSHSASGSVHAPQTPTREDSFGSTAATPDSRKRSKSMRSRSNSALGAPTVMAGIIAGSVAAGWSPVERSDRDTSPFPRPFPPPSVSTRDGSDGHGPPSVLGGQSFTDEPQELGEQSKGSSDVPRLNVPRPPAASGRKSLS